MVASKGKAESILQAIKYFRLRRTRQHSWKSKKYTFEDVPLHKVVEIVNRDYQSYLSLVEVEECLFTGEFQNESLANIVKMLQLSFDLEIEQTGEIILVSGEPCD